MIVAATIYDGVVEKLLVVGWKLLRVWPFWAKIESRERSECEEVRATVANGDDA